MNQEIDFQNQKTKCINAIVGYFFIFYILSMVIQGVVQTVIFKIHNIDVNLYNSILSSTSLSNLLESENAIYGEVALLTSSWTNLLVYVALIIMCLCFFYKDIIIDFYKPVNEENPETKFNSFFIWLMIFYGVNLVSNIFIQNISTSTLFIDKFLNGSFNLTTSSNNQAILELSILNGGFIPIMLSAGIIGPIVEELIYRKGIFGLFKNESYAFLTTSLIFGLIHVISSMGSGYSSFELLLMTIPYVVSGALFGTMYIRTNQNIWICTAVHMASNIISVLSIFALL